MKSINSLTLIGNEKTVEALETLVGSQRFPHSVLFVGERGTGKKTLAYHIAALLLGSERLPHPDLTVLECDDKGVGIDQIRELRSSLYERPNQAEYKVALLLKAGNLTPQAQNALLKMIEEPPGYGVFIMTAENPDSLLTTVLSRTVSYDLKTPETGAAEAFLAERYGPDEAKRLAHTFGGNIGRSILAKEDTAFGQTYEAAQQAIRKIEAGDAAGFLSVLQSYVGRKRGLEARRAFSELYETIRSGIRELNISPGRKAAAYAALFEGIQELERNGAVNLVNCTLTIRMFGKI